MKVAVIGLGVMGRPMADRLVSAGHEVRGFDINPAAMAGFQGRIATSQADAAQGAEALLIMVVSSQQAEEVLFTQGALAALTPNAVILLCPTCSPHAVKALAAKVPNLIDCPVSGGYVGAMAGTLTLMVACEDALYARALPLFNILGSKIFHVGQNAGQGAMVKMLNNLVAGVNLAAIGEAMVMGEQAGLDLQLLKNIFSGSAAGSWILEDRGARMLETAPEVKTRLDILKKDLALIVETGQHLKANIPLAEIAAAQYALASNQGFGDADDSQVIQAYRRNK